MTKEYFENELSKIRKYITAEEIARDVGMASHSVNRYFNGTGGSKSETMQKILNSAKAIFNNKKSEMLSVQI